MTVFIFIAALLVRNMEGFTSTQNFLSAPKVNQTLLVEKETFEEFYLLISILCYNSFAAMGVMILPWTLISELYPIQVTKNSFKQILIGKYSCNFCYRRKEKWVASQ